jgi:hypothetical protein
VLVSRNNTVFYNESIPKIFASLASLYVCTFSAHTLSHKASGKLQNALTIEHGIISTYKHTDMLKINKSYVKICESSCCLLNAFLLPFLAAFVSNVTSAVVISDEWKIEVNSMDGHQRGNKIKLSDCLCVCLCK